MDTEKEDQVNLVSLKKNQKSVNYEARSCVNLQTTAVKRIRNANSDVMGTIKKGGETKAERSNQSMLLPSVSQQLQSTQMLSVKPLNVIPPKSARSCLEKEEICVSSQISLSESAVNSVVTGALSYIGQIKRKLSKKYIDRLPVIEKYTSLQNILDKWPLYFEEELPDINLENLKQLLVFSLLINVIQDYENKKLNYIDFKPQRGAHPIDCIVDVNKLMNNEEYILVKIEKGSTSETAISLQQFFKERPEKLIRAFSLALSSFFQYVLNQAMVTIPKIALRMINTGLVTSQVQKICPASIGKFLKFRGRVVTVEEPKLFIQASRVTCRECSFTFTHYYKDGVIKEPKQCRSSECECTNLNISRTDSKCGFFQRVQLEGLDSWDKNSEDDDLLIVELRDGNISNLGLDDVIEVVGILKVEQSEVADNIRKAKNFGFYDIYLEVNTFKKMKIVDDRKERSIIRKSYKLFIEVLLTSDITLNLLLNSIAPEIKGQALAKYCALLSLVGGCLPPKIVNANDRILSNQKISCLFLGTRGLGKTRILHSVALLDRRSNQSK